MAKDHPGRNPGPLTPTNNDAGTFVFPIRSPTSQGLHFTETPPPEDEEPINGMHSEHDMLQVPTGKSPPGRSPEMSPGMSPPGATTPDLGDQLAEELLRTVVLNEAPPAAVDPVSTTARTAGVADAATIAPKPIPHSSVKAGKHMSATKRAEVQHYVNEQAHTATMDDPNRVSSSTSAVPGYTPPQYTPDSDTPDHIATPMPVPEPEIATVRFSHVTTDDGHQILTGREGEIRRCEDEPIRTPGAVQGFGVLMVLEETATGEDDDGGLLFTIRQVSENSTDLLGLSPQFLFDLECFTDLLDDDQEDTFRDLILSLPELEEEEVQGPQVVRLKGCTEMGAIAWSSTGVSSEPGTEPSNGRNSSANVSRGSLNVGRSINRRKTPSANSSSTASYLSTEMENFWSCWVAASRPRTSHWKQVGANGEALPPPRLIILEFELEHDLYNPLFFDSNDRPHTNAIAPSSAGSTSHIGNSVSGMDSSRSENMTPQMSMWSTASSRSTDITEPPRGLNGGPDDYAPPQDLIPQSTTSLAKPLRALRGRGGGGGDGSQASGGSGLSRARKLMHPSRRARTNFARANSDASLDVFALLNEINGQLSAARDIETFLNITVGVVRQVTRFHRVLVYQFDQQMNGKVVSELVDLSQTNDLYRGLMFPASDIPPQARALYRINKVRILYNRAQPTARMVLRDKSDLDNPLDMTHCFLRAMSPIHLQYLENMAVRASMSISIVAFGKLWGLIACHSYGNHGMRVSFHVRQMLRILSDHISRNIERLEYARQIQSRKAMHSSGLAALAGFEGRKANPTPTHAAAANHSKQLDKRGLVANADDMLHIFHACSGLLVIKDRCKLIGENRSNPRTMLSVADHFRRAKLSNVVASREIAADFPDLPFARHSDMISGLLYVPLTSEEPGNDFMVFFRKGQLHTIKWAGMPYRDENDQLKATLEPRKSFKIWKEQVHGKAAEWTEDQIESAEMLSVLYNKFIPAWRERQHVIESNQLTALLLSNTSHQLRTPLSQIINTLELALAGNVDPDTRSMLENSHEASRALLFHVHDLLELTGIETGNETVFHDPFNFHDTLAQTVKLYQTEANRRGIAFRCNFGDVPEMVVGDQRKIRTVVSNLVANAVKYTTDGEVTVDCRIVPTNLTGSPKQRFEGSGGGSVSETTLSVEASVGVEIVVRDTGCGIAPDRLEAIFIALEGHDDHTVSPGADEPGPVGLGLAAVGRIVEQLEGQLRAESDLGKQTTFYFTFAAGTTDIQSLSSMRRRSSATTDNMTVTEEGTARPVAVSEPIIITPVGPDVANVSDRTGEATPREPGSPLPTSSTPMPKKPKIAVVAPESAVRVLVVEDDLINSKILCRHFLKSGHKVVAVENGQEAVDLLMKDQDFDLVLMDMQMPVLDGWGAARAIRDMEAKTPPNGASTPTAEVPRAACRLDGRVPILALSASLYEDDRERLAVDFDGWLLKPLNFARGRLLLEALQDVSGAKRDAEVYAPGEWERGGFFKGHAT